MQSGAQESAAPAGSRLLTAREIQDRLHVDATTIYRMASDGRLPAVKVGRQWRFPADEVEAALADARPTAHGPAATARDEGPGRAVGLETSAVQAVLDVSAPMLGVMMVVTDMAGQPLTDVANPCPWFVEHADDEETLTACTAEWQSMADDLDFAPHFQGAALGFECARVFIRSGSALVGMVLAGGVAGDDDHETPGLHHLDPAQRQAVLDALPRVSLALSRAARAQRDLAPARPGPGSTSRSRPSTTSSTTPSTTRRST